MDACTYQRNTVEYKDCIFVGSRVDEKMLYSSCYCTLMIGKSLAQALALNHLDPWWDSVEPTQNPPLIITISPILCSFFFLFFPFEQVLVMAGQLKRENPEIQEDLVLIRALRDSNLPKFLADDAILFKVYIGLLQTHTD